MKLSIAIAGKEEKKRKKLRRMRPKILFLVFVFVFSTHLSEGYRILCLFPFNGRSHQVMFEAMCKGLAARGHQIDMISHYPSKTPIANYTDIVDLRGSMWSVMNSLPVEITKSLNKWFLYYLVAYFGGNICEQMGHEKMQKFIRNAPKMPSYDLILTEYFGSGCYLGFGHYLKAPVATVLSHLGNDYVNIIAGNSLGFAYYSGSYNTNPEITTFYDRLLNFLICARYFLEYLYYSSDHIAITRKYLGQDVPDVRELERNVSLIFVNGHFSMSGITTQLPGIVDIGGVHIEAQNATLSPALQTWLDSAEHGVVYFSFGSMINIETLPQNVLIDLYMSFAKISPVRVLMKSKASKLPPGLSNNVITSPWLPQIPILEHKNTRAFISHCGLMGTQEAIYFGVPVIGIPLFSDQYKITNLLVHKNMAVKINLHDVNERSMTAALKAVLYDPKYRESARKASKLFRDRPMNLLDIVAYNVEYVIRNGPNSLKSRAIYLPWWKLYLIDVFAFLIVCIVIVVSLTVILSKHLIRHYYTMQWKNKVD